MGFTDTRFTVNISILFTELPLLERPAAAAAAGFSAVELWWPWVDAPVPEQSELDALRDALNDAGTRLTGLNFYAGQLPGPDRGALSVPGEESDKFRANIDVAVEFARTMGCKSLNALYGNRVEGVDPQVQDTLALENLVLAARAADRIGATTARTSTRSSTRTRTRPGTCRSPTTPAAARPAPASWTSPTCSAA